MTAIVLDDTDRHLIAALVADGRATYAALAPDAGLSQAAVRTRVQRLLDEHVIAVTGRVDPSTFGLGIFGFAFLEISHETDKVAAQLSDISGVVFVVLGAGRFDALVEVRCEDTDRLLAVFDQIRVLDGVRRVQTTTVLHYEKQDWTGVGDRAAAPSEQSIATPTRELDDLDRQLLGELMADGRATYAGLAPIVGLSQAAVRDRVIDLIESRVITIQAHPVPEAMGIAGFAGIAMKVAGPVAPIARVLKQRAEATLVVRTLGRFDLLAEVWFDNPEHLAEMLDDLRAEPGIGTIDTIPYLRITHEEFATSIRR